MSSMDLGDIINLLNKENGLAEGVHQGAGLCIVLLPAWLLHLWSCAIHSEIAKEGETCELNQCKIICDCRLSPYIQRLSEHLHSLNPSMQSFYLPSPFVSMPTKHRLSIRMKQTRLFPLWEIRIWQNQDMDMLLTSLRMGEDMCKKEDNKMKNLHANIIVFRLLLNETENRTDAVHHYALFASSWNGEIRMRVRHISILQNLIQPFSIS